jgi:hypothetical protein
LNLVNLGGPLSNGGAFKLFNASSYSGSFTINPPTPGPNQVWDISDLRNSGTIKVAAAVTSAPQFDSITLSGNNLVMKGSKGSSSGTYYLLVSTNVALQRINWTPVATNTFDGSGNFTITTNLNPALPRQFFLLQVP